MDTSNRKTDPWKHRVETALAKYKDDPNNCGEGYNILSYAKQGMIDVTVDADPQAFVDWYPLNQGFVILRLAKQGNLKYAGPKSVPSPL